ncbi:hypothetical protein VT84_08630 [Gemmata sp. SH-PL17]|uniref:hypothetical protein n=1 Tax=Gemmata sp. SH-PL17 TaxID=1630693 RepID=UPI00078D6814|nr:hypothetical protein [Gemmata sp. SH-PL17]AMV24449.1 hypothetical protein VT84_08630 [Gemmata sp. SH-PL17]
MARSPLWLFLCPACGTGIAFGDTLPRVECPRCQHRTLYPSAEAFGSAEWDTASRPEYFYGCLTALDRVPSSRKRRLLYTTVARTGFDWRRDRWFRLAIEFAEQWADTDRPQFGIDDIVRSLRRQTPRISTASWDAQQVAVGSLSATPPVPTENFRPATQHAFADAYRELFPNPFVTLEWNPNWHTTTVRDLAQHIYSAREFGTMPILADALQDAGCDNECILGHCRANTPHVRGCWVLDALLGKS